jgi:hypothetical protein
MRWPDHPASHHTDDGDTSPEDDDLLDDDFYGSQASPMGAANVKVSTNAAASAPAPPTTSNQLRAQELRAKLIAQRQSTPIKSTSRAATPSNSNGPYRTPTTAITPNLSKSGKEGRVGEERRFVPLSTTGQERDNVAALIAEGEALAVAAVASGVSETSTNFTRHRPTNTRANQIANNRAPSTATTPAKSIEIPQRDEHSAARVQPTDLTDPYYDDLAAWLDLTNYHDVAARKALLQPFLEQRALEEEAARIAERIARLNKAQQESAQKFRFGTPSASVAPPPPLPASLPRSNGLKRERSPETSATGKAGRRDFGNGR